MATKRRMDRLGKHATSVQTTAGVTRVKYHDTVVVAFEEDDTRGFIIRLDSGGHRNETTRARMNQAAAQFQLGFQVVERRNHWYVASTDVRGRVAGWQRLFVDSMLFDSLSGEVFHAKD